MQTVGELEKRAEGLVGAQTGSERQQEAKEEYRKTKVDVGVLEGSRQLGCRSAGRIGAGSLVLGGTSRHK